MKARPVFICPLCQPGLISYAGVVIFRVCEDCHAEREGVPIPPGSMQALYQLDVKEDGTWLVLNGATTQAAIRLESCVHGPLGTRALAEVRAAIEVWMHTQDAHRAAWKMPPDAQASPPGTGDDSPCPTVLGECGTCGERADGRDPYPWD